MRGSRPQRPANIVTVVRPFEDPAPSGMHDFDLVTFFYAYHNITYLDVDRAKMNKAFYDALKPGGELVVGDYSAKPARGRTSSKPCMPEDTRKGAPGGPS
jgi:predicted methyltransferase